MSMPFLWKGEQDLTYLEVSLVSPLFLFYSSLMSPEQTGGSRKLSTFGIQKALEKDSLNLSLPFDRQVNW